MSTAAAPAFENSANCTKCNTTFNLFTRKHHCRQCGRTYCDRCSSWNIPLPHFGFLAPVRVDEKCYVAIQQKQAHSAQGGQAQGQGQGQGQPTATATATASADSSSAPSSSSSSSPTTSPSPAPARTRACTCHMPLCICPPDEAESKAAPTTAAAATTTTTTQKQSDKPVSRPASKTPVSSSSFSGFGSFPSSRSSAVALTYDLSGDLNEQCREAIKQGDLKGVQTLVNAGAQPNYIDRTGNTLLHLACMFDRWEVVSLFLSRGGDISIKNPAGETPIDLAPPSLAYKIKHIQ